MQVPIRWNKTSKKGSLNNLKWNSYALYSLISGIELNALCCSLMRKNVYVYLFDRRFESRSRAWPSTQALLNSTVRCKINLVTTSPSLIVSGQSSSNRPRSSTPPTTLVSVLLIYEQLFVRCFERVQMAGFRSTIVASSLICGNITIGTLKLTRKCF